MGSRWKDIERAKCRELGGERSGPTGRDTPDCVDICVGLEVKRKKKLVWLTKDWQQAKENAAKLGQPPVLAVKEHGRGRDMVQMHSATWLMFEIGAAGDVEDAIWNQYVADAAGVTGPHEVDGDEVMRMPWDYFVQLYKAYYRKEQLG